MADRFNTHVDYTDTLITDFFDLGFQNAFRQYFAELGINVKDWDGLFREMNEGNEGEKNAAWVRTTADGGVIGFIQFTPIRGGFCAKKSRHWRRNSRYSVSLLSGSTRENTAILGRCCNLDSSQGILISPPGRSAHLCFKYHTRASQR